MFSTLAATFRTATRTEDWNAPTQWREPDHRPLPEARTRQQRRDDTRRWLRQTGIM